jgi:hypothetical protein
MRGCAFAVESVVQRACVTDLRVASARGPVDSRLRLPNYSPQNIARVCFTLTLRNGRRCFPGERRTHALHCRPGVETMRSKHLLAITLLLPFLTMSSVASAGQTYGHWQKTTRLPERVVNAQAGPLIPDQYRTLRPCTYQGGPKTNTWSCW